MAAFAFDLPEKTGVLVCERVLRGGAPILLVSRDGDGHWQFLCGGVHRHDADKPAGNTDGDGAPAPADAPAMVSLKEIVDRDPTLNELATMTALDSAQRADAGAPWRFHDGMEDIVSENVEHHACHVMLVAADDAGPGFAYSIGLTRSFGQPELLCFSLPTETLQTIINDLRDRMAAGTKLKADDRVADLIEGFDCVLRTVHPAHYADFLGYALWFNRGPTFEALQIVWPDMQGRFPWDAGYDIDAELQPRLWEVPTSVPES